MPGRRFDHDQPIIPPDVPPKRISFSPENLLREIVEVETIKIPVESESRPGVKHYVSITLSCTCESWRYKSKCKHIHAILDEIAPRPERMK